MKKEHWNPDLAKIIAREEEIQNRHKRRADEDNNERVESPPDWTEMAKSLLAIEMLLDMPEIFEQGRLPRELLSKYPELQNRYEVLASRPNNLVDDERWLLDQFNPFRVNKITALLLYAKLALEHLPESVVSPDQKGVYLAEISEIQEYATKKKISGEPVEYEKVKRTFELTRDLMLLYERSGG